MSGNRFQERLAATRLKEHAQCVVCGPVNRSGLRVKYEACDDGSVTARMTCDGDLQGYRGFMHGGIISTLLDGAMTHCLFARGKTALTGEPNVRFLHPVETDKAIDVLAWVTSSYASLHKLAAILTQEGTLMVKATAKFMERDSSDK